MKITGMGLGRFGALLAGIGICTSIVAATVVIGDFQEMRGAWGALHWHSLVFIVALAVVNHALRYYRWEILLKRVTSPKDVKRFTAVLLFSAGSLLIFTPARVGEVAKSIYARHFFSVPMATSVPILIAERLADVVVMALLASLGLLLLGELPHLLGAATILLVALLVCLLWRPVLKWGTREKVVRRWLGSNLAQVLSLANGSRKSLLARRVLATNLVLGIAVWTIEVFIYFLSLYAVGVTMDSHLFVLALAVFPLASLAGSFSFLPGGLGATEAGLVGLGILLGDLSEEIAVMAALLSRAAILGVVVLVGVVSLPLLHRIDRAQQRKV